MPLLQELLQAQREQLRFQAQAQTDIGLPRGAAYAQYFPSYEVTSPQYQIPTAWSLSSLGYRTNEVAYACIDLWMKTISEPTLRVYDKKTDEVVEDHPLEDFLEHPCPDMSESDFWKATMMYLKIAGFMGWEKDTANDGSLIALWPLMPQYCAFKRGQSRLLQTIQYQPYTGLPAYDIDRDRVVLFMYSDPNFFGLKPLSPTAILSDIIKVDNDMTKMIQSFITNGAFVSGLLSTEQVLNEADARFAKERFRESHGGPNNAGDVVVTGKGMKFQPTNQTFQEMVFPEVDARSETRICQGYGVKPILVSAKVGTDRSTYNNYEQARQAWYEEEVTSEWEFLAQRVTRDLLPSFDDDPNHVCRFDTRDVKALQEDRTATWERSVKAYEKRIIVRNDALREMGLDPLDEGDPLGDEYYQTVLSQSSTTNSLDVQDDSLTEDPKAKKKPTAQAEQEEKDFRAFAKRRIKEGKQTDIPEFEFKFVDEKRQRQLLTEFGVPDPDAEMVLQGLTEIVQAIKAAQMPIISAPDVHIVAHIEAGKAPDVHIDMPEQKTPQLPAPIINIDVQPTPVNITNEVQTPEVTVNNTVEPAPVRIQQRERARVTRDDRGRVTGIEAD